MALTAGSPVPLAYGYQWFTGKKVQGITLTDTGSANLDYTRVGMWVLAEGEWDGLIELWDTGLGRLMLQAGTTFGDVPSCFQFHPGCDSVVGSGFAPTSTGGDQGVDTVWTSLPAGLQPLHYNRWAYYTIKLKWLVNNPPNTNQDDASVWADINPIGLWRSTRCRLFDASGNQVGYGFTRNPAAHYVDLVCRKKLFPEYNIDVLNGTDELPAAVRARFDWAALADSFEYYREVLPSTGFARFTGDYAFTQATTLQACLTQVAQNCRSFHRERAGQFALIADQPRASVFTFTRKNADNFTADGSDLKTAPNQFTAKYRDLFIPAAATIASISCPDHQLPHIFTEEPHCFAAGDYVVIGDTGTLYDRNATVNAIDAPDVNGNSFGLTLNTLGSAVPTSVGSGGLIGLRYSRFKDRAPEFRHKANQLARGAVGIGIDRQRLRVKVSTDFANTTWEQAARVTAWQMATQLGPDVQPYVAPQKFSLKSPFFAVDAAGSGARANQVEPGDVVTIDDTLSAAYAGLYEVVTEDLTLPGSTGGSGGARTPQPGAVALSLRPYSAANYPDTSATFEPGWPTLPTLPGNAQPGTEIPLADGFASFVSGFGVHGEYFELPDGYNENFMLCWGSPQGFVEGNSHLHFLQNCDALPSRLLQLIYNDSAGTTWNGSLNWSAICWRTLNSANSFTLTSANSGAVMTYVELILAGGEKVIFGKGRVPSNSQIPLPTGYTDVRTIAQAFGQSATDSGHPAHGFCAYMDVNGVAEHIYNDNSGNQWLGTANVMVFSYLNNKGTWMKDANGWAHCTLPGGKVFAVGGFSLYSPTLASSGPTIYGTTGLTRLQQLNLPAAAGMPSDSMQVMPGVDGYQITPNDAHGVKENYVQEQPDGSFDALSVFEDGIGNQWLGSASVFALLYDTPTGAIGSTAAPAGGVTWPATTAYETPTSGVAGGLIPGGPVHSPPGAD